VDVAKLLLEEAAQATGVPRNIKRSDRHSLSIVPHFCHKSTIPSCVITAQSSSFLCTSLTAVSILEILEKPLSTLACNARRSLIRTRRGDRCS
jgi:hypothetical protein